MDDLWIDLDLKRVLGGLEVWFKTDPRLEQFIKDLSTGRTDDLTAFGRTWVPVNPDVIKVYRVNNPVDATSYLLGNVGGELLDYNGPNVRANISFLQFAGSSDRNGSRFLITTPFNRTYVEAFNKKCMTAFRDILREYLVPIHVNIKISSQEI